MGGWAGGGDQGFGHEDQVQVFNIFDKLDVHVGSNEMRLKSLLI